jgi:hypothetical protein
MFHVAFSIPLLLCPPLPLLSYVLGVLVLIDLGAFENILHVPTLPVPFGVVYPSELNPCCLLSHISQTYTYVPFDIVV